MFAAKVGLRNVVALDVDHVATETAVRNISANGLEDSIETRNESIESTEERFGLILANLSASLLQNLAAELRLHLDKDGWLAAGGFLSGETNALIQTFRATGLELTHQKTKNDWGCLILQLRQP